MSTVNFSDPQVLQNYIRAQVSEGKGEYEVREEVVIFKSEDGGTYMVPGDLSKEVMDQIMSKAKRVKKEEVKKEEVKVEEPIKTSKK